MSFRLAWRVSVAWLLLSIAGCGDSAKEQFLVDLFATANQNVTAISFPADTETTVSINSRVAFTLLGSRASGEAPFSVTEDVVWRLSEGAVSRIDQSGLLTVGPIAESFTLTAQLGILTTSLDIRVSAARFDRVVQLDPTEIDIEMCQSRTFKPIGRYVDDQNNEEIRSVDSTIINTIEWIIRNAEDSALSSRAYIETTANQASLHALAAGDLVIQARALSLVTGGEETSDPFNQSVGNVLNSLKVCLAGAEDLDTCNVASTSVEKDQQLSLIGVASYQADNGSSFFENVTRNGKWGNSNSSNAGSAFSADRQQLNVTGLIEESQATISLACGTIEQALTGVDVSQGVNLSNPVSCGTNTDCVSAAVDISIDELAVLSLEVTANGSSLVDDTTLLLSSRPDQLTLEVTANFSNNTDAIVTSDTDLLYNIITIDGQVDIIESVSGSAGVYDVLGPGIAKIQLDFRGERFIATVQIP